MDADAEKQTKRLIAVLEEELLFLKSRSERVYDFSFISNAQAVPYTVALARWAQGGRVGPQPVATRAETRALIYNQARPASQLKAFGVVCGLAALELVEIALAGLKAGQILTTFTALRGLIERVSHAHFIVQSLEGLRLASSDGPLTPVIELSEIISRSLYGTKREWQKLVGADFRRVSAKEVKYVRKEDRADSTAANILNSVDKLDAKIPGVRLAYEVLCEFLHPNIGDLWGATLEGRELVDKHGTRHLTRVLGQGRKTLRGLPEQDEIYAKLIDVCVEAIPHLQLSLKELESISSVATRLTQIFAHDAVKNYDDYFSESDLCPCLSGLTIAICAKSKIKRR